ncbi:glutamate--tRNA ligase [Pedobacter yulinensis]|uniref:Glutamate--tRNA ligase n=1 Tax=Pedobacter yulinensis TaxID=2126353 RepID=A0A2T3HRU0_9SPHI|nr:glutamate--tRNA ligase [Pedobacter yulinensis]PST85139.1 glutamate--tRNA ligase [Pedobacter yulinensis]
MDQKIRVRFAPSPTGGLHLGGVRTALFNYLFARKNNGTFILRVEDTDQTRFVDGAEAYINACLSWCGIEPDESPLRGGPHAPYRQSERKVTYRAFAEQLVDEGFAYYAFDTPEELDARRKETPNFQYGQATRLSLRNSLVMTPHEVSQLLQEGVPHVIRIKVPEDENVYFNDLIRGDVNFDTSIVDDKVLLKADGMPTYHLAVVVDDKAMEISHVFRGEEWLPSAPVHILLWKYLGWEASMPKWAHLPLILKPDGNGKLSKRDGDRLGFPVYAMNWIDPKTGTLTEGFRERGFLPDAFVNMLALLGWNDGTDRELFSLDELVEAFDPERISKAGAKFDFEKAKWFNHEWIKNLDSAALATLVRPVLADSGIMAEDEAYLQQVIDLVKERCTLLADFSSQAAYFFRQPADYDLAAVKGKWSPEKSAFFESFAAGFAAGNDAAAVEAGFKQLAESSGFKPGELMLPLRVMLVGGKFGPGVFDIALLLGTEEVQKRISKALSVFNS